MTLPLMIFAAGFGTRMGALTKTQPKPLIAVGGQALLDHTLNMARAVTPARIVVNTHYLADQIADHLADSDVIISNEQPTILDTGGGLRKALPLLNNETVLTSNSDAIWSGVNPMQFALDHWQPDKMDALLVCVPLAQTRGRQGAGDFSTDADGRISRGGDLVYGGVQVLKTERLSQIKEDVFSLNLLWNQMQAEGRLFAVEYPGLWCDVGHPEGIDVAKKLNRSVDV
ncbi:MAG: nucleotidyltransferase family protein [Paracoccaceae bacterium]